MQRDQLERAAASYSYLRGLFLVPLGTVFILSALANWQIGPLRHLWAFPVAAALVAAACLPIARHYTQHYGRLNPSPRQQMRDLLSVGLGLIVMIGLSTLLRSQALWSLDLPVNGIAVSFALFMFISYAVGMGGLRVHHLIIWGALLVAGAVPLWTGPDPSNIGLLMSGVAVMICGVFDHLAFLQTFGPAAALEEEPNDARA
jgi:hypothetical protein